MEYSDGKKVLVPGVMIMSLDFLDFKAFCRRALRTNAKFRFDLCEFKYPWACVIDNVYALEERSKRKCFIAKVSPSLNYVPMYDPKTRLQTNEVSTPIHNGIAKNSR